MIKIQCLIIQLKESIHTLVSLRVQLKIRHVVHKGLFHTTPELECHSHLFFFYDLASNPYAGGSQ
jgi:hypothetical protein